MSLFKERKSKTESLGCKRITIDAKHNEKIKSFRDEKKTVHPLKKKLAEQLSSIEKLNQKGKPNMTDEELDLYFSLKEEIKNIREKISEIESNCEEEDYLLDTAHLLFHYYDKFKSSTSSLHPSSYIKDANSSKKTVLDFFQNKEGNDNIPNTVTEQEDKKVKRREYSKSEIINSYLMKVDEDFIYPFNSDDSLEYCKKCNREKTIIPSEGIVICVECGSQDSIIIDSDKPSYKDPPREISYFAYKRINHFNEWLAQFQAKESTEIPKEVFDKILVEIKKERIENMACLTPLKLREILKKLKLNKYYEHVPHIINRLNGLPAPVMTRETEEKLRMMFKEIQTPFLKHCPRDRKNFLSYSYVLHKFVQLLELDEFLVCFPLLKSREKLHQQDQIWKNICDELQWEFIKSL